MNGEDAARALQAEAEWLLEQAFEELVDVYEAQGGDAWLYEEPRFHIYKACDEFTDAKKLWKDGRIDEGDKRIQHGLNHLFMATYLASGGGNRG